MSKRGAGVSFISLAVILFIARSTIYYFAAITLSNRPVSAGQLDHGFELVSPPYSHLAWIIMLVVGVFYLIWAEISKE